jgi:glycosyltransferase involved in cell wall biosynthesis
MRLSIVICNYNYARFLDDAIASAVGQRYPNTEVIVIDDGSSDDSADVIRRWSDKVVAIFQSNQGQSSAYNRGFLEARGDVIIFLDSDDTLDPEAGEAIMATFRAHDCAKVHFRLRLVDASGQALGGTIPLRLSEGDVSQLLRKGLLYASSPGSGNAYRRAALARVLPIPVVADDPHAADFFAIHGLALLGPVRTVGANALGSYRVHIEDGTEQILFGNASAQQFMTKQGIRYARLRKWLLDRLGPDYAIADEFIDFSIQKSVFAELVFGSSAYTTGLRMGSAYLRSTLARSIWLRPSPRAERIGLLGWAVTVLLLPRDLGRPLARYVCNPASRGRTSVTGTQPDTTVTTE